jgi:hypothetical protein
MNGNLEQIPVREFKDVVFYTKSSGEESHVMKLLAHFLFAFILLTIIPVANSDVLLLDAIQSDSGSVGKPARGMSMDQVRSRYGEPGNELPWVGDPPITRWVYDDYTVYFEHQYVINSVVHR